MTDGANLSVNSASNHSSLQYSTDELTRACAVPLPLDDEDGLEETETDSFNIDWSEPVLRHVPSEQRDIIQRIFDADWHNDASWLRKTQAFPIETRRLIILKRAAVMAAGVRMTNMWSLPDSWVELFVCNLEISLQRDVESILRKRSKDVRQPRHRQLKESLLVKTLRKRAELHGP